MQKLNNQEKSIITEQNELVKEYITSRNNDVLFAISRDSQNHIIALFGVIESPIIKAKMLGLNRSKKPHFKDVGQISYNYINNNSIKIDNVSVENLYEGLNIDQIMIQSLQNFAKESGFGEISIEVVPSNEMLENFSKEPGLFNIVNIDPLILTLMSNDFVRFYPFGKDYLNHKPLLDPKYYLKNINPTYANISFGTEQKTSIRKIKKQFRPYKISMNNNNSKYVENQSFEPLIVYPSQRSLEQLENLFGIKHFQ